VSTVPITTTFFDDATQTKLDVTLSLTDPETIVIYKYKAHRAMLTAARRFSTTSSNEDTR
jgi:hypothetical protein